MRPLLLAALVVGTVSGAGAQAPPASDPAFARAVEEARARSAQVLRQGGVDPSQPAGAPSTATTPAAAPNVDTLIDEARRKSDRILAQPQKPPPPSYREVYGLPGAPAPRTAPKLPLDLSQSADPAAIAARYRQIQPAAGAADHELLVFVSTSMPQATLVRLGEQTRAAGGILVLRGIKGGLQQKNALSTMTTALQPVAATGVDIQIHPELFSRYGVTRVPTFVLARQVTDCGTDSCDARRVALAGDVSLDFVLERFSASPDRELAQLARTRLGRLEQRLP